MNFNCKPMTHHWQHEWLCRSTKKSIHKEKDMAEDTSNSIFFINLN